ncbi:MAG: RHS repeat-associated core domain-containing protein [Polyangiaceae bacterium]
MPSTRRAKYWEAVTSLLCFALGRFRASLRVQFATAGLVALITATLVSACGSDGSSGSNDRHLTEHERVRANSVAITEIPPGTEFYLNDAQGTPIVVAGVDGTVKERSNYHAYGLPRHQKGKRSDPFRYLGNERDIGSELSDFKARPYRPELGIFLSVDPVALFLRRRRSASPECWGPTRTRTAIRSTKWIAMAAAAPLTRRPARAARRSTAPNFHLPLKRKWNAGSWKAP